MIKGFVILLLVLLGIAAKGQESSFKWFPNDVHFPKLKYDLLEHQFYTGVFIFDAQSVDYNGAYIPVNIGLQKAFFQWQVNDITTQFLLGAASYTQFEIIRYDKSTLQGGLLNNDYKASAMFSASNKNNKLRIQLFHISSHLGDDYMHRNNYYELNDKTVNYEQLDLVYLHAFSKVSLYTGFGFVVSPNAFRDRFMMQLGGQANLLIAKTISLVYGADIKIYEEHGFQPDVHASIGVDFMKDLPQLNISIDGYFGKLPYSTLKMGNVYWLGLSTIVYI